MARKHREIFVSGHYLLLDAKLWASRNRSYPRTNIRAYFRANYWLLCLSSFKYFATHVEKFYEQLSCFSAWNVFLIVLPTSVTITKRHSLILNWISIVDLRFENWVTWLGWYSRISVAPNANNCSVKVAEQNRERSSHHIACSKSTVSVSLAEIP